MARRLVSVLACAVLCALAVLPASASPARAAQRPRPLVTALSPSFCWAGSGDTSVTVYGQNFAQAFSPQLQPVSWTAVSVNGVRLGTVFLTSERLTTVVPASMLATPGYRAVSVQNPPYVGDSQSLYPFPLEVRAETSVPLVTIAVQGGADVVHHTPVVVSCVATDAESGVTRLEYRCPPAVADWTAGSQFVLPLSTGSFTVEARAVDGVGQVGTASAVVRMEQVYPVTVALADVTAKLGGHAKLRYRVDEPADVSATVTVEIGISRAADGRLVRTVRKSFVPVGRDMVATVALLRSWCAAGRYVWKVHATDTWGSSEQTPGQKRLTVTH